MATTLDFDEKAAAQVDAIIPRLMSQRPALQSCGQEM